MPSGVGMSGCSPGALARPPSREGLQEHNHELMVLRKRRKRKGLQGDTAEVTPRGMAFPRMSWECVTCRKIKCPERRGL